MTSRTLDEERVHTIAIHLLDEALWHHMGQEGAAGATSPITLRPTAVRWETMDPDMAKVAASFCATPSAINHTIMQIIDARNRASLHMKFQYHLHHPDQLEIYMVLK